MYYEITPQVPDSQPTVSDQAIAYASLDDAKQAAVSNLDKSIKSAWLSGHALTEVKARLAHGQWREWLAEAEIGKDTANRLINLATIPFDELDKHKSVNAALTNLKVKRQAALPLGDSPPANVATLRQMDPPANDPEPPIAAVDPPIPEPLPEPIEAEYHEVAPDDFLPDRLAHAEALNSELIDELSEVKERLALATEHFDDDAYATLAKVNKAHRAELATLRGDLHSKHQNYEAIKRKLGRAKSMLLDCKSGDAILADVFHLKRG